MSPKPHLCKIFYGQCYAQKDTWDQHNKAIAPTHKSKKHCGIVAFR